MAGAEARRFVRSLSLRFSTLLPSSFHHCFDILLPSYERTDRLVDCRTPLTPTFSAPTPLLPPSPRMAVVLAVPRPSRNSTIRTWGGGIRGRGTEMYSCGCGGGGVLDGGLSDEGVVSLFSLFFPLFFCILSPAFSLLQPTLRDVTAYSPSLPPSHDEIEA